jgi:cell division protein FtsQ
MERRQTVAEDNAKRNVSRLLRFLGALVAVGAAVWLMFSPWLSVSQVDTTGVSASSANAILADHGVVAGTPMIRVDVERAEGALLEDPWIAEAVIELHWPDVVTVDIVERTPVAWMETADGWSRRALDGVALPSEGEPDPEMAVIEMSGLAEVAAETTPDVIGALQFIDALPPNQREGTVVTTIDGEIWATVGGYRVRLGRAVEMEEKAASLVALLGEKPPVGSVLVLIAPTNPAVATPGSASSEPTGDSEAGTGAEAEVSPEEDGGGEVIPDD